MQNDTTLQLMAELGELLGGVDLRLDAQKRTVVSCGGLFVQLALPDDNRLRLSSWIGTLPQGTTQLTVAQALLAANHFFALTGGATLAVEPVTHQIWLHQDLPLAGADAHRLFVGMEQFVDTSASWFDKLHETEDAADDDGKNPCPPLSGTVYP